MTKKLYDGGLINKAYMKEQLKKILLELKTFKQNIGIYAKYFIIIKLLLFFILIPAYNVSILFLISSTGQKALTSGNIKSVMMTPQGVLFIVLTCIFLMLYISMDINTAILISAAVHENRNSIRLGEILKEGLRSAKIFLSPVGLLFVIYSVLLVPLAGVGLSTSITKGFRIPGFITMVIYDNKLYFSLYAGFLVILTVASFLIIFTFHYIILKKEKTGSAVKKSIKLVLNNVKDLSLHIIIITAGLFIIGVFIALTGQFFLGLVELTLGFGTYLPRFLMLLILIIMLECMHILMFFFVPLEIHSLTAKFYEYENSSFGSVVLLPQSPKRRRKITVFLISLLLINIAAGSTCAFFFDEMFKRNFDTVIVAHRGGGDLGPENTIKGMEAAVKNGAAWSEIDVQRAKDGKYVINHDATFKRLTGDNRRVFDMTWEQIQKLTVKDMSGNFPEGDSVPSFEDTMDFAKGNIGLFIELKGKTADKKMADDVVSAIMAKGMDEEAVVISLDYGLVDYVENKYPNIKTGYLYFFVVGDASKLNTDYLIMEEDIASIDIVQRLHKANKQVLVWTVNNEESVVPLLTAEVDGIITDNVKGIKKALDAEKNKKDIDVVIERIMNIFK